MIVDAFKDTLELGLEKPKQIVVRFLYLVLGPKTPIRNGAGGVLHETWSSLLMRPLKGPSLFPFAGCMTKRVAPCDGPGWAFFRKHAQLPLPCNGHFARDVDGFDVYSQ